MCSEPVQFAEDLFDLGPVPECLRILLNRALGTEGLVLQVQCLKTTISYGALKGRLYLGAHKTI